MKKHKKIISVMLCVSIIMGILTGGVIFKTIETDAADLYDKVTEKVSNLYLNANTGNCIVLDRQDKTIKFDNKNGYFSVIFNNEYVNLNLQTFSYDNNTLYFISYDYVKKQFGLCENLEDVVILVGRFRVWDNGTYELLMNDDVDVLVDGGVDEQTSTNIVGYFPNPIEFNFEKGIIEIPAYSIVRANKVKYVISEKQELTMDTWGWLAFDTTSGKFVLVKPTAPETKQQIICGLYVKSNYTVMMTGGIYYTVISDEHPEFVVFGDSITVGAGSTTSWEKILHEKAGVNVHTYGVGGSSYIAQPEDGIKTIFGYGGYEGVAQVLDRDVRVITRLKEYLPNIDTEYVILSAGTNDFYMGYSLDEFKAAIAECVEYVYSMGKTPILLSPMVRLEKVNKNGINLVDYVNAVYEVSLEYNVPYIDCYNGMGLYPEIEENRKKWYYDAKAIHPNNAGYYKLACRIYQGLKETFILKY